MKSYIDITKDDDGAILIKLLKHLEERFQCVIRIHFDCVKDKKYLVVLTKDQELKGE